MLQPALATRFLFLFCQCSFRMLQFPFVRKKIQQFFMNRPFVIGHSNGREQSQFRFCMSATCLATTTEFSPTVHGFTKYTGHFPLVCIFRIAKSFYGFQYLHYITYKRAKLRIGDVFQRNVQTASHCSLSLLSSSIPAD